MLPVVFNYRNINKIKSYMVSLIGIIGGITGKYFVMDSALSKDTLAETSIETNYMECLA